MIRLPSLLAPLALVVTLAATLAACTATPEADLPDLRFVHMPTIDLAVTTVVRDETYRAPIEAPHVAHEAPVAPATALVHWGEDRLRATGEDGATAVFTIIEATLTEESLKRSEGLTGILTKEQSERYTAVVEAKLEISERSGLSQGSAIARVSHSRTVAEDITLNERRRAQFELVDTLMQEFNRQMEGQIRAHLTNWVR